MERSFPYYHKSRTICSCSIWSFPIAEQLSCYTVLTTGATAHTGAYFGEGSGPIHLDFVQCSGSEYNLTECEIRNDHIRSNYSSDVGVKCQPGR